MSKIQKALEALRTDGAKRENGEQSRTVKQRPPSQALKTSSGNTTLNRSLSNTAIEEIRPSHKICVDTKSLEESGLIPRGQDLSIISDQFRRIKRPVLQCAFEVGLPVGDNANVVMIASALPGAGKSFCSFNLAQSISIERDVGAVLVDADVLKASISRSFGLEDRIGLIDYLIDPSIDIADILVETDLNDIIVVPAGRRHPEATELLASRRMQDLIKQLSARFAARAVIFDTPPLLITNEARVLAEKMGQIVFVIEARVSSQESVLRAIGYLDSNKPINAILNKSRSASESGYHSDDYGYYPYRQKGSSDDSNV